MHPGHKNGHKKPVTPDDNSVIPAEAGASADGTSIQRGRGDGFPPLGGGNVRRTKGAGKDGFEPRPYAQETRRQGHILFPSMAKVQSEGDHPPLDVEAARKSMARMANIFADIAKHAEESSLTRCPYKDAKSRCTAKFGCSNQHFTKNPLDQPVCTAKDGDLDYRSAWEID